MVRSALCWAVIAASAIACGGGDDDLGDGNAANAPSSGADGGGASSGGPSTGGPGAGSGDSGGADAGPRYDASRGPINDGPDPFMTFYDGNYYLATTQGDAVRMWKAPSIGALLGADATTVWQDGDASRNQQVWAPSFYLLDGHWYVYYTADDGVDDHHRLYVVESSGTDPLGPYHFKARLDVPGADYWAIDPVLLPQKNGTYMVWSGAGPEGHNLLYVAPMSNPWTISGGRAYLPASGGCAEVREAPAILQHGGTSFLVYSTCDTGKPDYQLWMKSIPIDADPMVPGNWHQFGSAVVSRNDAMGVFGPGSNGFFKSPDGTEDWIVYHAKNTAQYTYDARTTRVDKIAWRADGTPDFGQPLQAGADRPLPAGDPGTGSYWIDDDGTSNGPGKVEFDAAWTAYPSCGADCSHGNDHGATAADATATFTFDGTQITLLSARDAGNGLASVSLDGAAETTAYYWLPIRQGEQIVYKSPRVPYGTHTLKVRATGMRQGASTGSAISVDRAEVQTR